jgi:tetratricopeptide (TPR) repeat protein
MLEGASVAGVEFSTAAVAAVIEAEMAQVEAWCEGLARRGQFLSSVGLEEQPDGTVTARYRFSHTLYQQVLYDRVGMLQRRRMHQRLGEREEAAYGDRARERAAELAIHFEQGGDTHRALQYRQQAGENAFRQHGYREAAEHFTRGLDLLMTMPDTIERAQQELQLHLAWGGALIATKGFAVPEVERVYARARTLCQRIENPRELFPALTGLWAFYNARAELNTARALGEQSLRLAHQIQDPTFLAEAYHTLEDTLTHCGELIAARAHFEAILTLAHAPQQNLTVLPSGLDPRVANDSYAAILLWLLGYPDLALQRSQEGIREIQFFAGLLRLFRRENHVALADGETTLAVSTTYGLPFFEALGKILRGGALSEQGQRREGIIQIQQGIEFYRVTGARLGSPFFLAILADAYRGDGRIAESLRTLEEAITLVEETGERVYEAELYRLKGELLLWLRAGEVE